MKSWLAAALVAALQRWTNGGASPRRPPPCARIRRARRHEAQRRSLSAQGREQGARDRCRAWRRLAGRQPRRVQILGPVPRQERHRLFAISYRLGKPGIYPRAVYDVKSAIQFVRAKAADSGPIPSASGCGAIPPAASSRPDRARGRPVHLRIPQRSERRDSRHGQVRGRLLRRPRHAGAMEPRSDRAPARQHRGEIPRRLADAEPAHLFRILADQLCDGGPHARALPARARHP